MRAPKKPIKKIRGAGGEGEPPQQRLPVVASDSLSSTAVLRIVDLIAEGEIEGLVDGAKSIYLDETPLQSENGDYNFGATGITYDGRLGTQDQTYIPGFSSVENEIAVSVEARYDVPVVRQITNPNVNRVRVRVLVPQLYYSNPANGDVSGTSVAVSIWVQPDGGSYARAVSRTISGKSSNRYEVTLEVELTGDAPWNVKLVRDTVNATSDATQNKTFLSSYTEIIDAKLRYPNSAIIAMKIDGRQFQNVPRRAYDVKLLKIQVPSNYDPETREYTGSWDGTFQTAWSDNPAWVMYDIATNERYGLGAFIPEDQFDKWAMYEIGQYCDELVPDGFGGTEPRFTCNMMLADRGQAFNVLNSLASVYRGMVYWAGGTVTSSQDSPQDSAMLFTPANVVDGKFTYQGASAKARHSVALVSWNDPEDFYKLKVEYVEDQDAIASFGVQQVEIVAFGCTSRGQAHRLGKWLLYTEQNESETVVFSTGLDGVTARPGQIISIADPIRAGARKGGRISSSTTTHVTVDQELPDAISGDTLALMLPSGEVEESTVIGQSGRVIEVQPAFTSAPNAEAIWLLRSSSIEAQTFRVIGIKEDGGGIFSITALKHDPDKFDAIENDIVLEEKTYSDLRAIPDAPQNLTFTESLYQTGSEVRSKVTVSWDKVDRAASYVLRFKRDDDNYIEMPETTFNEIDILDTQPGVYSVQVSAINAVGRRSVASNLSQQVYGKLAAPTDVQGFSMIPSAGQAYLTWTQATDLDVLIGGEVRLRHTPRIVDQSWFDAVDIVPAVPGTATSAVAPLLTGTYMAKFLDSSGNYSDSEVLIITTVPYANELNVVQTETEHTAFAGTKTDMVVVPAESALALADGTLFDDYGLIDDVGNWDFPGSTVTEGTYTFQNTIDLGGVWPFRIITHIDLEAFSLGAVIDNRITDIDTWEDFDGDSVADVNAEFYVRTTEDDPSGSPTWTDWKRVRVGEYSARGIQLKLICTSNTGDHNLYIRELSATIDMADRALEFGALTSGVGASYRVDYTEAFFAAPAIGITAENMGTGDYYTITTPSATGFNIVFKNSAGTIVSRSFYAIAKGYGRKVA